MTEPESPKESSLPLSPDEAANLLRLPAPPQTYDAAVTVKVWKSDLPLARLVAREHGFFDRLGNPVIAPLLRVMGWNDIVARGKELMAQAIELQKTGT